MRKLSLVITSGAFVALMSATPVFAFTTYGSSVGESSAANFSDPDAQVDRLTGTTDTSGSNLAAFGGSAVDATAAKQQARSQLQDDQTSFSGFYFTNK